MVGLEGVVKLDSIVKPFATVVIASADQALEVLNCLSFGLELPCVEDLSCLAFVGLELPCVEDLSCLWPLGSCEVLDFHPRKTIPGKSLYLNHPKRKVHEIFVLEFLESSFFESFWDIREADLV